MERKLSLLDAYTQVPKRIGVMSNLKMVVAEFIDAKSYFLIDRLKEGYHKMN